MKMTRTIWLLLILLIESGITAQTKVKVLTLVTEKTYTYPNEFLLDIEAEKADVTIETKSGNTVSVVLKQIVKNPNQTVAEKHIKAHKFIENATNERLFLKNYILFDEPNENSGSIFKNEYTITVPEHCHVKIKNTLGNMQLKNLKKSIAITVEYGKTELINCTGTLNAHVTLGELTVNQGTLTGAMVTRNCNLKLHSAMGNLLADCTFGTLSVYLAGDPVVLDAKTTYCETTLINKSDESYALWLQTTNGSINSVGYDVTKTGNVELLKIDPAKDGILPLVKIVSYENSINYY